jgi:hypothetical protein
MKSMGAGGLGGLGGLGGAKKPKKRWLYTLIFFAIDNVITIIKYFVRYLIKIVEEDLSPMSIDP